MVLFNLTFISQLGGEYLGVTTTDDVAINDSRVSVLEINSLSVTDSISVGNWG